MQDLAPLAIAVALSPMPIAALLLILLSNKAKLNSIGFLIGWMFGIIFLVLISMQFATGTNNASGNSHILKNITNGILGILLILFAIRQFKNRPKNGEEAKIPKWMSAIENFSPIKSFIVGSSLAIINFKNTPMGIAAGVVLSQNAKTSLEVLTGITFYALLAGSTILVPVVAFLVFGDKLKHEFEVLKSWFIYNNATILFVIFLILGIVLISKTF